MKKIFFLLVFLPLGFAAGAQGYFSNYYTTQLGDSNKYVILPTDQFVVLANITHQDSLLLPAASGANQGREIKFMNTERSATYSWVFKTILPRNPDSTSVGALTDTSSYHIKSDGVYWWVIGHLTGK
jgi:hypothetical protein